MTDIDPIELGHRLRALRVDPPDNGFEAKLAERLSALEPEAFPVAAPRVTEPGAPARVIPGPWRRWPVRLIGATALFVAGAAAALEGGVVEWLETRVLFTPLETPAPVSPPRPPGPQRNAARAGDRAPALAAPRPEPTPPVIEASATGRAADEPEPSSVPRLTVRRPERTRPDAPRPPERPPSRESVTVPRVAIEPRALGRADLAEPRLGRPAAGVTAPSERGRDLERIREIARNRRERAATSERPRLLEALRERRERAAAERREMRPERARRERLGR